MKRIRNRKDAVKRAPNRLTSGIVESLQVPKDLAFGSVIATITGQSEAFIENYRGIIEYTDHKIKLQTKTCKMELVGKGLNIEYYTNDEMKITGHINQINYMA